MATMNRNVNLEEVNTDAFMGISYLNYQSLLQKVVFVGGIVAGIAINLIGTFVLEISINMTLVLTLIPLVGGVAYGCNYNEDLSLIRYFKLLISKPSKAYYSKPTEDLAQLHMAAERIKQEEALLKQQKEKMSDEAQKQLLVKLGIFAILAIVAVVVTVIVINAMKTDEVHHIVTQASGIVEIEKGVFI
ncbi:MAG: hypothetical protein PHY47_09475 [Lachnospiraceae bacterium]|nr:hypothetical protein [Lachnospiraceae bacterium]